MLNLWVGLGLAPHMAVFHAAHSQKPKAEGNAGHENQKACWNAQLFDTECL